jgi:4-hydroxy-3-polyprenylbenzoate decarboxylase
MAAYGDPVRELSKGIPEFIQQLPGLTGAAMVMPGVLAVSTNKYKDAEASENEMNIWNECLRDHINELQGLPMIIWCDDASFTAASLNNFLWVTFTRSNPATDVYGIGSFTRHKHWGCEGPMIIDARVKPHHAPALVKDPAVEKSIDGIFAKGGSLAGVC